MKKLPVDEKALLDSVERGEWRARKPSARERARLQRAAAASLRKTERVNIRISRHDLDALRSRAAEEGLPYQTLMASVLHKYVSGRLHDARG
ncbi:MAG: antitoxin [Candidatus Binatia bacterium]